MLCLEPSRTRKPWPFWEEETTRTKADFSECVIIAAVVCDSLWQRRDIPFPMSHSLLSHVS